MKNIAVAFTFPIWVMAASPVWAQLNDATTATEQTLKNAEQSQKRIDQLDDQTQNMLNDYRANLKQLEQLQRYNKSQKRQINAQKNEINSLHTDISNIAGLQRSVRPLMDDMLDGLEKLVRADVPFLLQERTDRVARLRKIMDDPEKTAAQRYRLIVEAYQIENEYGRTVGSYRADVKTENKKYQNAQFLRVGRDLLVFKTDDDSVLKIYDKKNARWTDLNKSYLGNIKTALRVANKQIPPELLELPVSAPIVASAS